jgi:hypothetical protein
MWPVKEGMWPLNGEGDQSKMAAAFYDAVHVPTPMESVNARLAASLILRRASELLPWVGICVTSVSGEA